MTRGVRFWERHLFTVDFSQLRQQTLWQVAEHRRTPESQEPKHLTISLNESEHALCAVAAAEAGETIEVWMRNKIITAARTRRDALGQDDGPLPT
jgi:NTP pyrophosphatase (non-canonical NTP hydrolase)